MKSFKIVGLLASMLITAQAALTCSTILMFLDGVCYDGTEEGPKVNAAN
jgi:hypothetical protein